MQTRLAKRAFFGAVGAAAAVLVAGAAQAALQDRDLNGDTVTDAFYDTDLNITWLRNANVNGRQQWDAAVNWASSFSFGGYSDWRLPTNEPCLGGAECAGSEMVHLWYVELGNSAGAMTNTGDFQNLQSDWYWAGRENERYSGGAYYFSMDGGFQGDVDKYVELYALAVRAGDVAAVPEPQGYALLMLGLIGLALKMRRRPR